MLTYNALLYGIGICAALCGCYIVSYQQQQQICSLWHRHGHGGFKTEMKGKVLLCNAAHQNTEMGVVMENVCVLCVRVTN